MDLFLIPNIPKVVQIIVLGIHGMLIVLAYMDQISIMVQVHSLKVKPVLVQYMVQFITKKKGEIYFYKNGKFIQIGFVNLKNLKMYPIIDSYDSSATFQFSKGKYKKK